MNSKFPIIANNATMGTNLMDFVDPPKFRFKGLFVFKGFKFTESLPRDSKIIVRLKRMAKIGRWPACGKTRRKPIEWFMGRMVGDLDVGDGFNDKISVIKRMAFGFRDLEYFKVKILQCRRGYYSP